MKKSCQTTSLFFILFSMFTISKSIAQNNFAGDYIVVRLNHKLLDFGKIDNPNFDNQNFISYLNEQGKLEIEKSIDSIIDLRSLKLKKIFPNL